MPSREEVRSLLRQLDGKPADGLESETLDFTRWEQEARARVKALRESVVCFANAQGGTIVVGVRDRVRTRREALEGVGPCDLDALRKSIYEGTDPHVLVEIEALREPEAELLLIHVPRGIPPHTTSDGVGKIRVGKECRPLKGSQLPGLMLARGGQDLTAQPLPESSMEDADFGQLQLLRRVLVGEGGDPALARLEDRELLGALDLLRNGELTLAAVLLVGRPTAIARWAPQHEVTFLRFKSPTRYDVRKDLKGPLLEVLDVLQRLLEAHLKLVTVATGSFGELSIPDLTWYAAREAVLNALVHRDYFLRQSVLVELHPDRLEITSPGGFVGNVRPDNVLRHPPVRRNPLLAGVFQSLGLVNRAGLGVDRIYEELLRLGKSLPRYSADEAHVGLVLPLKTSEAFARFVARELRAGKELQVDDLIVLRSLAEIGTIDRRTAAVKLQCDEEHAAGILVSLRRRGYLLPHGRGKGTSYRFVRALSDELRGAVETDHELTLDAEAVRLKVRAVLEERGSLTNTEARRLTGYSRLQVARLMRGLAEEGQAALAGRGRGAHWVPGPAQSKRKGTGARRRNVSTSRGDDPAVPEG